MQLKKLMSVILCAVLSTQSFAIGEKEAGKEEEDSSVDVSSFSSKDSRGLYILSEIERSVIELGKVYEEQSLSDEVKIEKLNQMYCTKIIKLIFEFMSLLNYPGDESDDLKLASFLINYYVWIQLCGQVSDQIQIPFRLRFQVKNPVLDQVGEVKEHVWPQGEVEYLIGDLEYEISFLVFSRITYPVRVQVASFLNLHFDFAIHSNESYKEKLKLPIHYSIMIYQIHNILKLISLDGQKLRSHIASLIRFSNTQENIYHKVRSFYVSSDPANHSFLFPVPRTCPLINIQRFLLRIHLPRPETESVFTLLTGVLAIAVASASSSNL